MPVHPTAEQMKLLDQSPQDTPVVMLNLLRFAPNAHGGDITGAESFGRYQVAMYPVLKSHGAEILWHGNVDSTVIGPDDEHWDAVVLVRYPNRPTFEDMANSDVYQKVTRDRTAVLDDSRLIAMTEASWTTWFPKG